MSEVSAIVLAVVAGCSAYMFGWLRGFRAARQRVEQPRAAEESRAFACQTDDDPAVLRTENARLHAALAELVRLQDMRKEVWDRFHQFTRGEGGFDEYVALGAERTRRQPAAWANARAALQEPAK